MKIAFIGLKGLPSTWTGIEFHVDRLGRGLAARGHEVTAYTRRPYTPAGVREHGGMTLISLPTIVSKHLDASVHSFLASCHAAVRGYDVIHFHGIGPGAFGVVPRLFGRLVVCTVHRLDWQAEKWGRAASRLIRAAESVSVRAAHRTIAVSAGLQAHLKERHRVDAVLIPNGCDRVTPRKPALIRERYGLEGCDYVLFMGRLSPEKRVDWLIRAFLAAAGPPSGSSSPRLVVAGGFNATDEYAAGLRRLADGDPRIVFTGFVAGVEKEELLSNALVFALPSRVEGLPIVLLEAKGYGVCCLASDIPPHREIIRDGVDGVLFDAADPGGLTAKLRVLLRDPERALAMGVAARARTSDLVSWDEVVARTETVYRGLVQRATT